MCPAETGWGCKQKQIYGGILKLAGLTKLQNELCRIINQTFVVFQICMPSPTRLPSQAASWPTYSRPRHRSTTHAPLGDPSYKGKGKGMYTWYSVYSSNHHLRSAQVWHVFSKDLSFTCTPTRSYAERACSRTLCSSAIPLLVNCLWESVSR